MRARARFAARASSSAGPSRGVSEHLPQREAAHRGGGAAQDAHPEGVQVEHAAVAGRWS